MDQNVTLTSDLEMAKTLKISVWLPKSLQSSQSWQRPWTVISTYTSLKMRRNL